MMTEAPGSEEREARAERALDRLEERVRDVQHLHPFSMSRREDGRFSCSLEKPLSELSVKEARAAADALEELARFLRRTVEE